jgi:hypothetical protein
MESDATPQQALAEVERATAGLWAHYPPTPWWYCPASGAWHAGFVLAFGGLHDSLVPLAIAMVALMALAALFASWYTRYRGAIPKVRSAPEEFTPAIAAFVGGYAALAAAVVAVLVTVGYVVAALVAFVGVTALLYVYERAYAAAAAATRERLG